MVFLFRENRKHETDGHTDRVQTLKRICIVLRWKFN